MEYNARDLKATMRDKDVLLDDCLVTAGQNFVHHNWSEPHALWLQCLVQCQDVMKSSFDSRPLQRQASATALCSCKLSMQGDCRRALFVFNM